MHFAFPYSTHCMGNIFVDIATMEKMRFSAVYAWVQLTKSYLASYVASLYIALYKYNNVSGFEAWHACMIFGNHISIFSIDTMHVCIAIAMCM